jgi:hypothetical protein
LRPSRWLEEEVREEERSRLVCPRAAARKAERSRKTGQQGEEVQREERTHPVQMEEVQKEERTRPARMGEVQMEEHTHPARTEEAQVEEHTHPARTEVVQKEEHSRHAADPTEGALTEERTRHAVPGEVPKEAQSHRARRVLHQEAAVQEEAHSPAQTKTTGRHWSCGSKRPAETTSWAPRRTIGPAKARSGRRAWGADRRCARLCYRNT